MVDGLFSSKSKPRVRGLYWKFTAWLMKHYERYLIRRSSLGLFHSMDCYEAYSRYCANPHLVHDIHLDYKDLITKREIDAKTSQERSDKTLVRGSRPQR